MFFNDTDRSDFIDRPAVLVEENAAVRELGYSGADVARYSGVANPCVTRFVASGKKHDVADLFESYERSARTLIPIKHYTQRPIWNYSISPTKNVNY